MMSFFYRKLLLMVGVFAITTVQAQQSPANHLLPFTSKALKGKLANGLTYYIQKNQLPKDRVELRLVIKAGSILESDQQQGLAHFVEHMAFNGTKHFSKNELVDFLERSGVRFGADLNAYTSFDETVYKLSLPTDTPEVFLKGFDILEDWAHGITFDSLEVDKERGVILEERRLRLGSQQRIQDQTLPVILRGSKYAERLPIGKPEILKTFHHQLLLDFYKDWYRPDLMAVIVVGDINPDQVEKLIKEHFSSLSNPVKEKERKHFSIPQHDETLVKYIYDKEAQYTQVQLLYKRPELVINSKEAYLQSIKRSLYNSMLNSRINELRQDPDAPFLGAASRISSLLADKDAYSILVIPKDNKTTAALKAILEENVRLEKFGFTQTELDRAKNEIIKSYQNAYDERDKRENESYASEYIRNFLDDEAAPGITYEYELVKNNIGSISLQSMNQMTGDFIKDKNRVVLVIAPEDKQDSLLPKEELLAIIDSATSMEVTAYEDIVATAPLYTKELTPRKIVSEESVQEIGLTILTLENGTKVFLKPTDFKNRQVLFSAYSPGGISLYTDTDYLEAETASTIINQSGIAGFNEKVLKKMLEGKNVSISPHISSLSEGLSGYCNYEDIETLFQLTSLYFTQPRFDQDALKVWEQGAEQYIKTRYDTPGGVFSDTLNNVLTNYSPRKAPLDIKDIHDLDFERMQEIYKERFANAGDFAFFFVGSFNIDSIKPLIQQYIGNLPNKDDRKEVWKDLGINPPSGIVKKNVYKGSEPKSQVVLSFNGPAVYSRRASAQFEALGEVLTIRLRESLREDAGGVYGVSANAWITRIPSQRYALSIGFGCSPDKVNQLIGLVFKEIDKLKAGKPLKVDVDKVLAMKMREHETAIKKNGYWMNLLKSSYERGIPAVELYTTYDDIMSTITVDSLHKIAKQYFDEENYIQAVLYPEKIKN